MRLAVIGLGLLLALVLGELTIRLTLAVSLRSMIRDTPADPPADPEALLQLGQILYRVEDPQILYRLIPNTRGVFGRPLSINSHGWRGRETTIEKPPGTFRLLGVGDSTMFGWQIDQHDSVLDLLERDLQAMVGDATRVEAINLSVPTYNSAQEAAVFLTDGLALKPDAVLMQFDINDLDLFIYAIEPEFLLGRQLHLGLLPELVSRGFQYREQIVERFNGEALRRRRPDMFGWDQVRRAYREVAEACRREGIPLWVLMPPICVNHDHALTFDDAHLPTVRRVFNRLGIETIEILPLMQRHAVTHDLKYWDLTISREDYHPNALGHALMAQAALPTLARDLASRRLGPDHPYADNPPAGNTILRRITGRGLHQPEDWGGTIVNWTRDWARMQFEPLGRRLVLRYHVAHPELIEKPLELTFTVREAMAEPPADTGSFSQTLSGRRWQFTHQDGGYFSQELDLDGLSGRLELTVELNRAFWPGDGRMLGIGLYPLDFKE